MFSSRFAALSAAFSVLLLAQCSLVTVPIETAGSIVTTTVKTTGKVLTAPFGGKEEKDGKTQSETKDDQADAEKDGDKSKSEERD
jgi:hypothetical protein